MSEYLTVRQVADRMPSARGGKVTTQTVRRWMLTGINGIKLKYTMVGGTYCTTQEDLDVFLNLLTRMNEMSKK